MKLIIHKDRNIEDALRIFPTIKDISRIILFVVNDNEQVIGTLTDGDVRRSLLQNGFVNKTVGEICNKVFDSVTDTDQYIDLRKYREQDIKIIPVLDKLGRLTSVIDTSKMKAKLPLECMIMAGGRGKRLSPLTDNVPKPMLLLGNKPIIEHNIDLLISFGIQKIYISVKYLGQQIVDYFGDGSAKGIEIEYIWEEEELGTAGALALVENFESEHVLLMNSDLFTNVNFEAMYLTMLHHEADMVVASSEFKINIPYAIFETQGSQVMSFKEKPSYIYHSNGGIYIMRKDIIKSIPRNQFCNITDVMDQLISSGGKLVYDPIVGFWIDIGKPVDYQQAQAFVKYFE